MADFVRLTCPSCGATLKITHDVDRFACAYCGTEHIVRRGEGIVSLAPVVESLKRVEAEVDKATSELAIIRLKGEIDELRRRHQAMLGQKVSPPPGSSARPLVAVGAFALVLGLWALVFPPGGTADNPALPAIALGLIFLVWGWAHSRARQASLERFRSETEAANREIQRLDEQIRSKQTELDKHETIVSS